MQESRRRLRQGRCRVICCTIWPIRRYVEQIVDESWTEHLRRFDRVTADKLRERKLAFHREAPPRCRATHGAVTCAGVNIECS